jgi:hypothetical protein
MHKIEIERLKQNWQEISWSEKFEMHGTRVEF